MKEIFVFGHRNPDTDSVCSAIALSYLKNKMGLNTVPKILSDINNESKFVLDYFNVKKPSFINDVKIKIRDINYAKGVFLYENQSIDKSLKIMGQYSVTAAPLVDENNKLVGYVTLKDLSKYLIDVNTRIDTTLTNIIKCLDATVITNFNENITGEIIAAALDDATFISDIKLNNDKILIVGNRKSIIEKAIEENTKLIIISCDKELEEDLIIKAKEKKINIIKTKYTTFNIANKINLSNYTKIINIVTNPVILREDEYYTDFLELAKKTRYSSYPVLDKKDRCLGLIRTVDSNEFEKREVILVDHNTVSQSAIGLEEASLLEIVDHHNLGSVNTVMPISFRSMPVGCTSTIIYKMFLENQIDIPLEIAGLMLSAILSDTLLFTSPTTTQDDKLTAIKLSQIAKVDLEVYGKDLMKAASNIDGLSVKELVNTDFKSYSVEDKKLGISVLTTMDYDAISKRSDEIIDLLNEKVSTEFTISVLFATDVIANGSYLLYDNNSAELLKEAFDLPEIYQGIFIKDLVSRKKQMLPKILEMLK